MESQLSTIIREAESELELVGEASGGPTLICNGRETTSSCFTLYEVKCHKTEDWDEDECRIEVFVDGIRKLKRTKTMKEGQLWRLGYTYPFAAGVVIKLWDEDWPDADDLIGTLRIDRSTLRGSRYSVTTRHVGSGGPDYGISFRVKHP